MSGIPNGMPHVEWLIIPRPQWLVALHPVPAPTVPSGQGPSANGALLRQVISQKVDPGAAGVVSGQSWLCVRSGLRVIQVPGGEHPPNRPNPGKIYKNYRGRGCRVRQGWACAVGWRDARRSPNLHKSKHRWGWCRVLNEVFRNKLFTLLAPSHWGKRLLGNKCCFCPLVSLSCRLRQCFAFSSLYDCEIGGCLLMWEVQHRVDCFLQSKLFFLMHLWHKL